MRWNDFEDDVREAAMAFAVIITSLIGIACLCTWMAM